MSKLLRMSLAAAMVAVLGLALGLSGCKKDAQTAAAVANAMSGDVPDVTAAQREQAAAEVAKAYESAALSATQPSTPATHPSASFADEAFRRDLAVLTKNPHRLAGFPDGSVAASMFVENRLKAIGVQKVAVQEFPLVQPVTKECSLTADGKEYKLYACRPNVLLAPVTPAEGLTGQTWYAAAGEMSDYGKVMPAGKIVVFDINCGKNWLNAFAFGAKAVIFIGSDKPADLPWQHVNLPANLPRFYVTSDVADALALRDNTKSRTVTIKSAVRWQELRGRNVIGIIRGTNAKFDGRPNQAIVLACPLDSLSEVPELSNGAREGGNIAAMLQIAKVLAADPPRRDVILAFFDGQTLNHAGARAFYGGLYRTIGGNEIEKSLETTMASLTGEADYRNQMIAVLKQPDLFTQQTRAMPNHVEAVELLRREARNLDTDVLDALRLDRLTRSELETSGQPLPQVLADRMKQLEIDDLAWNVVQRYLYDGLDHDKLKEQQQRQLAEIADEVLRKKKQTQFDDLDNRIKTVVKQTHRLQEERLVELNRLIAETRATGLLRNTIGGDKNTIVMHMSMNLGDARPNWTFVHGEDSAPMGEDKSGNYSEPFRAMEEVAGAMGADADTFYQLAIGRDFRQNTRLFAPGQVADSGAVARMFSLLNMSVMTAMDRLPRQGQPCDTPAVLDTAAMFRQASQVGPFLRRLADHNALNTATSSRIEIRHSLGLWNSPHRDGPTVKRSGAGSGVADLPVRDTIVAVMRKGLIGGTWGDLGIEKCPPGFDNAFRIKTDTNGVFEVPVRPQMYYQDPVVFAVKFDNPGDPDRTRGIPEFVSNQTTTTPVAAGSDLSKAVPVLCKVRIKTLVGYGWDRGAIGSTAMWGTSTTQFRNDRYLMCEWESLLTLFAPYESRAFKLFNKAGMVALNNAPQDFLGKGISMEDMFDHPVTALVTAHDLQLVNAERLGVLQNNRIDQPSLVTLNGQATDMQADAIKAAKDGTESADWYFGTLEASGAFSRRVYTPLIGVMNDLVTAVVLLLLLAMPFAYALERLLIGTPHIYRQIGWFAVFFVLTFAMLYLVNPAFRIASTPIIIFLAYAIILLSSLVIFIMVRKLQGEVRKMQGLSSTVHSADVSRLSTMMAAVNMGISTMRRRPLRTFLTAATVVLLTFTILTFASFGSSWGTRETYEGPLSGSTSHIMVRHQLWNPVNRNLFDAAKGALGKQATLVPRWWVSPTAQEVQDATSTDVTKQAAINLEMLVSDPAAQRVAIIAAGIGIEKEDIDRNEALRQMLDGDVELLKTDGIFLTGAVCSRLGLTSQDIGRAKVVMLGRQATFAGVIREKMAGYAYLEGSSILPVDYQSSVGGGAADVFTKQTSQTLSEMPDIESAQFVNYNLDRVVVLAPALAQQMKARVRSFNAYPNDPDKIKAVAEQLATMTELPTYVGDKGGVYRLIFTSLTKASGWRDLLIPVLLGGLIIFATMLGSVSDREKEIYTFSSLGLAPAHVASLFFAEASMYAVIGGMGGYLLGQAVARLLAWLSSMGLMSVPTMNYSSTNAIVTILIVMSTVLISTIYPAMKASRSANPGIQRSWKIPSPKNNVYDLKFPFTVSAYDITGVASFLREHFDNYTDASLGAFATLHCHIFRHASSDMLGIRAQVALAPFDLGVTQDFALLSQPSDIEGIDEVRIMIRRLSGAQGDWQRANRVFINDLRKQLLIWRSLPDDVMDKYRQKTLESWDQLAKESPDFSQTASTDTDEGVAAAEGAA